MDLDTIRQHIEVRKEHIASSVRHAINTIDDLATVTQKSLVSYVEALLFEIIDEEKHQAYVIGQMPRIDNDPIKETCVRFQILLDAMAMTIADAITVVESTRFVTDKSGLTTIVPNNIRMQILTELRFLGRLIGTSYKETASEAIRYSTHKG